MAASFTISELEKAAGTLLEALKFSEQVKANESQFKIARDACIKRFEYCIELAWKVSLKKLGSQTRFPKPAVRDMARADLIDSAEEWLDFIEARNNTSHSYDEEIARKVFVQIQKFSVKVQVLIANLKKLP